MSEPKIAWCHRANDNYYTDEQTKEAGFPLDGEILKRAYIKFIEHSAYLAMRARAETAEANDAKCEAARKYVSELLEAEREKVASLEAELIEWKSLHNIQLINQEHDNLRAQVEGLRTALEVYAITTAVFPEFGTVAKEAIEKFGHNPTPKKESSLK